MKGPKLHLHEAIAVVLLSKANRTASFDEIAFEINARKLYTRNDMKPLPPYQVKMRVKLSGGRYSNLFHSTIPDIVTLRNIKPKQS